MPGTLDWKGILQKSPVFRILGEKDIVELLEPRLSEEHRFAPNSLILREGDVGVSLFVIGSGEVTIEARSHGTSPVTIATLGEGEIFGEMAFFEKKPRSATVVAKSACQVREIKGDAFRDFLLSHPRLEFKITSILSERLRRVTEGALRMQFGALAEEFTVLNTKTEAKLETIENAIKTTHALFDATDNRARELSERAASVIDSAKQNQERFARTIRIFTSIGAAFSVIIGYLGIDWLLEIQKTHADIEEIYSDVRTKSSEAEDIARYLNKQKDWFEPKYYQNIAIDLILFKEIEGGKPRENDAKQSFYTIMTLGNETISNAVLTRIVSEIPHDRVIRTNIRPILRDSIPRISYKYRLLLYYILLTSFHLDGEAGQFHDTLKELKDEVELYKSRSGEPIRVKYDKYIGPGNIEEGRYAVYYHNIIREAQQSGGELTEEEILEAERMARRRAADEVEKIKKAWDLLP